MNENHMQEKTNLNHNMAKKANLAKLKLHYMLHGMGGSPVVPFG